MGQVKRMVVLRPGLPQTVDLPTRLDLVFAFGERISPIDWSTVAVGRRVLGVGSKAGPHPQNTVAKGGEACSARSVSRLLEPEGAGEGSAFLVILMRPSFPYVLPFMQMVE